MEDLRSQPGELVLNSKEEGKPMKELDGRCRVIKAVRMKPGSEF